MLAGSAHRHGPRLAHDGHRRSPVGPESGGPLDNGAQPGPDRSSALGAFSGLEYGPAGETRHPKSRSEPVSPNFYGRGDEFLA